MSDINFRHHYTRTDIDNMFVVHNKNKNSERNLNVGQMSK